MQNATNFTFDTTHLSLDVGGVCFDCGCDEAAFVQNAAGKHVIACRKCHSVDLRAVRVWYCDYCGHKDLGVKWACVACPTTGSTWVCKRCVEMDYTLCC